MTWKRNVGDECGDTCYHCQAARIWIHDPTGRLLNDGSPGWMRGCPNFRTSCPGNRNRPQPAPKHSTIDPAMLAQLVAEQVKAEVAKLDLGKREVQWKIGDRKVAELKDIRPHASLDELIHTVQCDLKCAMLVGPAGTGKTTLCAHLAKALDLPFASVSCSEGMSETTLRGTSVPNLTTGQSVYHGTDFVRLFESGGVFLLDELDACDPNVLVAINSALANGYIDLPERSDNPRAVRHADSIIVGAANTYGKGGDSQYQGRNALDAATLDRFVGAILAVDYDRKLEETLVPDPDITLRVWAIREKVAELGFERIIGTRALLAVAKLRQGGLSLEKAIKRLMVGWTADETRKIGQVWR